MCQAQRCDRVRHEDELLSCKNRAGASNRLASQGGPQLRLSEP